MLKPKRRYCGPPYDRWKHKYSKHWEKWQDAKEVNADSESQLEIVTVFGSVKKNLIYKDFKGGEIVSVFGGTELNLTQSDIEGTVIIDAVQVFGGTKLIIPPHWQVKSEISCVLGGVEDKRPLTPESNVNNNKVLILRGTCCFGGLEITSS